MVEFWSRAITAGGEFGHPSLGGRAWFSDDESIAPSQAKEHRVLQAGHAIKSERPECNRERARGTEVPQGRRPPETSWNLSHRALLFGNSTRSGSALSARSSLRVIFAF